IAMQPAVPLWKVIVGVMPARLKPGPQGPGFFFCPSLPRSGARERSSHPQALLLEPVIKVRDVLAVAIVQQRRPALLGADILLGRLAPARMRHLRIDVRPEAILGGLQRFPETLRALITESEMIDRFD